MTQDDWDKYGGLDYAPSPDLASRSQQIAVAQEILADQGVGAWRTCGLLIGLTEESGSVDLDTGVDEGPHHTNGLVRIGEGAAVTHAHLECLRQPRRGISIGRMVGGQALCGLTPGVDGLVQVAGIAGRLEPAVAHGSQIEPVGRLAGVPGLGHGQGQFPSVDGEVEVLDLAGGIGSPVEGQAQVGDVRPEIRIVVGGALVGVEVVRDGGVEVGAFTEQRVPAELGQAQPPQSKCAVGVFGGRGGEPGAVDLRRLFQVLDAADLFGPGPQHFGQLGQFGLALMKAR